ncbi:serine hydrolase [Flavobacterium gawalongense]|uniref:Serine hydrolase n=1 Tax=Flavobacterium gawalongense TaxID=2594432 RepID=A0A553BWJ4_9FLAO|nr:serine hydrolase [Flavobacterium gawalongense]TRX01740.1 serine hydrolase [Flavobacterium gawalongense]TRX08505.1 serine hydrolase [Flavobacterium gawalongense]TRX09726.1 serine hydrolase [Flavobacterium gawalongense]TRX12583.1 serine hydrolase [Flavobacterium gawalongense]TRX26849.1 serine hydrolase [Flavobacterium gawalongense]
MTKKILLSFIIAVIFSANSKAQVDKNSDLYKAIISKDSLLFNVGFNTCDISQFENLLSNNLKFYHDKDGISDKTKFLYDLKNGLCKNPETRQVKRILVKESTKIFPLYKNGMLYGAVQQGEHLFYEKQENQPGIAKFTNVWQLENGDWKLATSLSFDHQAYQLQKIENSFFDNDAEIEKWLQENKVPTLGLGIIENGKLKQIKVFGEITKGVSAPYNTIFNVASLTKPVTAMVALKLVSLGKWNLDEPVYKYWTDLDIANDPRNKKLTTRLILSHQTGFPNWRFLNEDKKLHFQFDPRTKYQYSGEGLEYLKKALEKKFNKSLQQLANELIFQPLKMYETRYVWDKNVDTSRLAIGYDKNGNAYETVRNKTPNAADDLLTTIEDYGKFLVSVMNSDGLTQKVFDEMISHQVESSKGKHFGLGFEIYDLGNGEYALSHGGSDKGVQTIAFIFPKTKQGLLIFTNSDTGASVYENLLKHYLGKNGQKIFDIETK